MSRILYFTRDYTSHDHRFLSALAGTEEQVFFLQLERQDLQLEDRPLPPQIQQVRWAGGQQPVRWIDYPRLLMDFRRVIDRIQPDLIHAGPIQRSAFLAALSGFKPLASMSWGYDLLVDASRGSLWRWATTYTLKRSSVMIGDCETIRQKAISFGMAKDRIITFPWGVEIDHFTPADKAPGGGDGFWLLSTRGWEPIYGTEIIAQAFVKAARHHPDMGLIMLGHGSQANRIHQIFSQAGISDRVHLPGQVSHADLPQYYRMADLYVSASFSDGTSISLLEAMASGCPVIVSDIPGNREWVASGVNGWLFPKDDVDALSELIQNTYEHRHLLAEAGREARRLVEQRADWKKNFPNLLKAYQIALHSN